MVRFGATAASFPTDIHSKGVKKKKLGGNIFLVCYVPSKYTLTQ